MKENYSETSVNTNAIIWAYGAKNKYVHAFPGLDGLEAGVPLCGISIKPTMVLENVDPDDEHTHGLLCPHCRARLGFAKFIRPASAVIADRKGTGKRNG